MDGVEKQGGASRRRHFHAGGKPFDRGRGPQRGGSRGPRPFGQHRRPTRGERPAPRYESTQTGGDGDDVRIPPLALGNIRIIPLGGVEEIGRNMTLVEIRDDIIVINCGLQFSEDDTPGVDFILPDTKYLEDRKEKIRGIFITHGHLDHIGAIPFLVDRVGYPPIYSRRLTTYTTS